jgi:hypothetical protein
MTTLYTKRGRRYIPWGHLEQDWHRDGDLMQIGTFRLVHCPAPGHYRTTHDVTPDTAAFLAAAEIAAAAMEQAIHDRAMYAPDLGNTPYTAEQRRLIEQFRQDMAATGALIPSYWTSGTACAIARAGIDAVRRAQEAFPLTPPPHHPS